MVLRCHNRIRNEGGDDYYFRFQKNVTGLWIIQRVREEIAKGRQVIVVYPMIYENEKLDLQNMERGYE